MAKNHAIKGPYFAKNLLDIAKVPKRPHLAEQASGHHKCTKIMRQNIHILLKKPAGHHKCVKNPVTKHPHFAKQPAGHHKWVQNFVTYRPNFASRKVDMMSKIILRRVDIMSHVPTVHLEVGVDEK